MSAITTARLPLPYIEPEIFARLVDELGFEPVIPARPFAPVVPVTLAPAAPVPDAPVEAVTVAFDQSEHHDEIIDEEPHLAVEPEVEAEAEAEPEPEVEVEPEPVSAPVVPVESWVPAMPPMASH